ncbi:fatty acid desaturase, partial [bacterium]
PYTIQHFGIFPLLFSPFGFWSMFSALSNSVMADILTNLHTFAMVSPNHTGDDLYRFDSKPDNKAERYFRQVIGSVNYDCGNDLIDFTHLWLNYQIEHHLYPDIPMLKYQEYQPQIKAICEKYNVPYIQENVFIRIKKMVDIAVGNTTMKKANS